VQVPIRRLRSIVEAALLTAFSLGALAATVRVTLVPPPSPGRPVAIVFAPWTDAASALKRVADAGGRLVSYGGMPFVTVAIADDANYAERAFAAGAWFVLDPAIIEACLRASEASRS